MVLGGAACALLLAVLAGEPSSSVQQRSEVRQVARTARPERSASVSATRRHQHERLVGDREAPLHGALELPRPAAKPLPGYKRFDSRHGLAPRPEAGLAPLTRMLPPDVSARRHGRIADRPLIENCPAQGPPRLA
ncbi:hypothetical protein BON30_44175 [Cystobacter ferrugineus]|uniref:Uncharacterized protein n=2 Tax=Cystobacter ferrugineus TaxID=83449 RepID=A0A1L9AWC3_9BACT|nr:hypothetical protein BON30_44175 [Cystobacter ferrugineus]